MGVSARQLGEDRDTRILELAAQLGYVTSRHVARLVCGGRDQVARERLLQLTRRGLLARHDLGCRGQGPYAYHLPSRRPGGHTLRHSLAVVDVYAALAATQRPGVRVDGWYPEFEAGGYRADALLLAMLDGTQPAAVFVEVDMATERPALVTHKVEALADYRDTGAYRRSAWWRPGMLVAQLVVAPGARATRLRPDLEAAATRTGQLVGVVDQTMATTAPWPIVQRLLERPAAPAPQRPSAEPPAAPAPQSTTAGTAPEPGARRYTPAWRRGSSTDGAASVPAGGGYQRGGGRGAGAGGLLEGKDGIVGGDRR